MSFAAGLLALAVAYVGHRWLGARNEVADLRVQVALLKRRLARRGDA